MICCNAITLSAMLQYFTCENQQPRLSTAIGAWDNVAFTSLKYTLYVCMYMYVCTLCMYVCMYNVCTCVRICTCQCFVYSIMAGSSFGAGQLSKPAESTPEFQMRGEDFPALPGTSSKSVQGQEHMWSDGIGIALWQNYCYYSIYIYIYSQGRNVARIRFGEW